MLDENAFQIKVVDENEVSVITSSFVVLHGKIVKFERPSFFDGYWCLKNVI